MVAVPRQSEQYLLDAGCGRGGTAAYLQAGGWGQVTGIDLDADSIKEAAAAYPGIAFRACDIYQLEQQLEPGFALVTLFNVLYALDDQRRALGALARVARPAARLVILDYIDRRLTEGDEAGQLSQGFLPNPPKPAEIEDSLVDAGWQLESLVSIDERYERWYSQLVAKIEAKRGEIEALAGA